MPRRGHSPSQKRQRQWYAPFSSLFVLIIHPGQDTYVAAVRTLGLRYTPLELLLKQVLDTMWDEDLVERAMLGIEEGMVRSEFALCDPAEYWTQAGVLVADQQNVDVHDGYLQGADAQDQDLRDANPQDQDLQDVNVQDQDVEADDVVTVPRRAAGKRKKTVTLKVRGQPPNLHTTDSHVVCS